jgi:hypothetical protein
MDVSSGEDDSKKSLRLWLLVAANAATAAAAAAAVVVAVAGATAMLTASKQISQSKQILDPDSYHPTLGPAFFSVKHLSSDIVDGAGGLKHVAGLLHARSPNPSFLQSIATIEAFAAHGVTKTV